MRRHTQIALGCVALTTLFVGVAQAEPLTPPAGPVAGTGPTQIFALPFAINQPGSYIVARDLTGVAAQNGITINASGVTLDLGGFTLQGVAGSFDGINMPAFRENVVIQNGAVRGWGGDGVLANTDVGRIERISAANNGGWGIVNGGGTFSSHIVSCEALFNGSGGFGGGISAGINAVVTDCVARSNTGAGIFAGVDGVIEGCVSQFNSGDGIGAGSGNIVVTGCTAGFNGGSGILIGPGGSVTGCTVHNSSSGPGVGGGVNVTVENTTSTNNFGSGFQLGDGAVVRGCTASNNLAPAPLQAPPSSPPGFDSRRAQRSLSTTSGAQAPSSPRTDFVDPFADYVNPVVIDERTGEVIPGLVNFGAGTEGVLGGSDGFRLGIGSTIEGCSAIGNADDGIAVGLGSTVINCSASNNGANGIIADDDSTVRSCTSRGNGGAGVIIDPDGVVRDSTANNNTGTGIVAGDDGTIFGNKVEANIGGGIVVNGSGCRVDSNHVAANSGDGIQLNGGFTVVVRNHLELDTINDGGFLSQQIGPINDLTNPWTNFSL